MYDIIIIGAGTAGMTSAIYAARAGKKVLLLEGKSYGGQIINSPEVDNYPGIKHISGFDFATNLYEQVKLLEVDFKFEQVLDIDVNEKNVTTKKNQYQAKAIILAVGAVNRLLGLPNEKELTGKGVSYCATCDGPLYKNKTVAVVGGGNTALEDANFLSAYCENVYLIHRKDKFKGEERLVDNLKEKKNICYLFHSEIKEIIGEKRLEALVVLDKETQKEKLIAVDGLFVTIGQIPATEEYRLLIDLDEKGYIKANEDCKTSKEGIFVAGDCRTKKVRQLATAASDGAVAALMACEYIENIK